MWLSQIIIKNFRNVRSLDVKLGKHAVVLGENKVGETNFLFGLRLILDPSLFDATRRLRLDDLWGRLGTSAQPSVTGSVERESRGTRHQCAASPAAR
jgi:putative ATP-dependent endonuclease of the OLD family